MIKLKKLIYDDVYNEEILIIVGYGLDSVCKKYNLNAPKDSLGFTSRIDCRSIIYLKLFNFHPFDFKTLCHECFHLAADILNGKDINFSEKTEEVFAYYTAYLFDKILKVIVNVSRNKKARNNKRNKILAKQKK